MERSQTLFEPELNLTPIPFHSIPLPPGESQFPIQIRKTKRRTKSGGRGEGFRVSLHYYCRQSDYFLMQTKDLPNVYFPENLREPIPPPPNPTTPTPGMMTLGARFRLTLVSPTVVNG
jgi:hypothetical protein